MSLFLSYRWLPASSLLMSLSPWSFILRVEILVENLVHGEHMHSVLFEDGSHSLITPDLALIVRVLQVPFFNVLPDFLNGLRAR